MPKKETKKPVEFEKAITELEQLVEEMEDGDLSLEDSLKTFETGIKLTRECQDALQNAEQKVSILIKENDQEQLAEFREEKE